MKLNLRNLTTTATFVIIAAGGVLLYGVLGWHWTLGLEIHDRTTLLNTVLVIYTCLLTAVAAVVALLAYRSATGRPALDIEITFNFSSPNEPVFLAAERTGNGLAWRNIDSFKQSFATVVLKNSSLYAAKNPGVRIELEGLGGIGAQLGWEDIKRVPQIGTIAIQWNGGTDSIVHGRWSRTLPSLDFSELIELDRNKTALVVTLVADGLTPLSRRMPVCIYDRDEYAEYTQKGVKEPDLT
ncbi:hypothetical protein ACFWJM_19140 [Streptomyces sp. NPDC127077]|uniref:hypothetical protein n=1 Tax=Streptomyces sp. NPDC127077 TaxID=3347131 RepID=UPI00364A1F8B